MNEHRPDMPLRSSNSFDAFLGESGPTLTEDEQQMRSLLVEEYKKTGKSLIMEIKAWREKTPLLVWVIVSELSIKR